MDQFDGHLFVTDSRHPVQEIILVGMGGVA
jgi:hypothetical protein